MKRRRPTIATLMREDQNFLNDYYSVVRGYIIPEQDRKKKEEEERQERLEDEARMELASHMDSVML